VINGLGTGGAERSLAEMLEPISRHGIKILPVCLYPRDEGVQSEVMNAGYEVRFVGPPSFATLFRLRDLIAETHPDVIHTTIFEADIIGRLASIGSSTAVVSSIVNTSYAITKSQNPHLNRGKLALARVVDGFTARHLNTGFHALTETVAEAAVKALGIKKISIDVIPRGRNRQRLGEPSPERRREVRRALGIAESTTVLLSVGRQEFQKGHVNAVEALAVLRSRRPNLLLLIAGRDGAASDRLRRATVELDLKDHVRILGHRSDVPDLMVAADLLTFPSLYEGFGGALIEAMALDLSIVASDLPAIREVTGDTVAFVTPGSFSALAVGIEDLLDDDSRSRQLRQAGRDRFEKNFTIDSTSKRMAAFYHAALDS